LTTHLALVGPTATGKSELALALAEALGDVELVSIDSMQVYRGLDIGTAKPSPEDRARIPHHMLDVVDPDEDYSVATFQRDARAAVAAVEARGRRALLVGGTGLYVQAVIDDLRFPGEDLGVRAELEARTAEPGGVAAAYAELARRDPVAAARIDPHNTRRIVRALEVLDSTGEQFSSFGCGMTVFGPTAFAVSMAGIWLPREVGARRIADRVTAMRAAGLVTEVDRVGPSLSRTAAQAIGYRELLQHRREHEVDTPEQLDDVFGTITRRTRSFARRQRMWFRRDPRIAWFGAAENPAAVLPALLARWGS
jgi:tRNA dimethylallyltransferase